MVYAKECLDREAEELSRSVDLFTLPVESFSGGKQPIRSRLAKTINILCDAPTSTVDHEQLRAEAEFSKQLMAAIEAGDGELASELERKWNQRCEQRKAEAQQDREIPQPTTVNTWEGDVSLLIQARNQGF